MAALTPAVYTEEITGQSVSPGGGPLISDNMLINSSLPTDNILGDHNFETLEIITETLI